MPVEKLENGAWPHPARLPLGCGWSGRCTAPEHEGETPAQNVLETCCNLGYANSCGWAPRDRRWDAVRFAVAAPAQDNRKQQGVKVLPEASPSIRVDYVCERAHLPVAHGHLEFDLLQSTWQTRHEDARVQRMAECFLESYSKRRS